MFKRTLKESLATDGRIYNVLRWAYQPVRATKYEVRQWRSESARRRLVPEYLEKPQFHGLQIGCGPTVLPGWINTDFDSDYPVDFIMDITRRLPFPGNSFDAIYGEEVIEHIDFEQGKRFLSEARRILKPGGAIRLTTPGADELCRVYLGLETHSADDFEQFWINPEEFSAEMWLTSNFSFYGHKHIWSSRQLQKEMKAAGFDATRVCKPHVSESGIPQLSGLERRYGDAPDWIWIAAIIVEGQRTPVENMGSRPVSADNMNFAQAQSA